MNYDAIVIIKNVIFLIAIFDDVWCITYEPYRWNLYYFVNCIFSPLHSEKKHKDFTYVGRKKPKKNNISNWKTNFDKAVHNMILSPIHFFNKISDRFFNVTSC